MVDRLELVPGDVRGGGNITTLKDDFKTDENTNVYGIHLGKENTFVNGKLMTVYNSRLTTYHSSVADKWALTFTAPRVISPGDTVTVNFTALCGDDAVNGTEARLVLRSINGETVFWEDEKVTSSGSGSFTVTVPSVDTVLCEWVLFISHYFYQNASCHRSVVVADLDFDFNVVGDKSILQTGETCNVVGVLTGTIGDDVIGIPGQTVNFYEQWTPGLRVSATPGIIQSGDESTVKAQLIDTTDGSLVREEGHTVNFYWDDAPVPVPTTLTVSIDNTVLSYADGDVAHFTLTLYDQYNEPVAGEYISLYIDGELRTRFRTNGDGQVTNISYHSTGVGDVVLGFECGSVSETVTIEDCWNAHLSEISITGDTVNSIGMDNVHNVQNDDFILEFDHKGNGNICIGATSQYSTPSTANYRLTLGTYGSKYYCAVRTSSTDETSGSSEDNSTYYSYKIEKEGTTVKFYANNVLIATKTASFFTNYDAYSIYTIKWGGGTDYVKNIRLKPL